jgi:predicted DNA-binding transcriptional regulator
MEIVVEGSARSKKFVEAMLPSMVRQLGLEKSRKALLIRVANECEGDTEGMTIDLSKWTGAYLVIIKPKRNLVQLGLTLAHEMVHVKQLAKGLLKQKRSGHTWLGKMYSKKTPYLQMPWEIEAYSKQELILRRALEE